MIADGMEGWRNPARYLAPLAIAAVAVASYVIIHKAIMHKHASASASSIVQSITSSHARTTHRNATKAKFYIVRPNDTMSKIAARTGVSLGTLEQLNPNVSPGALHPQQRLRLRQ